MNSQAILARRRFVFLFACLSFVVACTQTDREALTPTPEPTATNVVEVIEPTDVPPTPPSDPESEMVEPTQEPDQTDVSPTEEPLAEPLLEDPVVPSGVSFVEGRCLFQLRQTGEVICGTLIAPENRDTFDETGRTVALPVAIFKSESVNPAPDPVVYLSGGPGGSAVELVDFTYETDIKPFLAERDYIILDQRGTGGAEPSLFCDEVFDLNFELLPLDITDEVVINLYQTALEACRDRLESEGVDLSAYHSAETAADLDALRQILGIETWNLFGVSYGTRIAQTYARDFPEGVRSMILDSPVPIDLDLEETFPISTSNAFRRFFDECAADAACSAEYPDLENRFYTLIEQLDAEPIEFSIEYFFTNEPYDVLFKGSDLQGILFQSLYSDELFPLMPEIITDVEVGDTEMLSLLFNSFLANEEFLSLGAYYSSICFEELPFADPAEVEAASQVDPKLIDYFSDWESSFENCEIWDIDSAEPFENEPITADTQALIMVGGYDPVTPIELGEAVADQLTNDFLVLIPQVGHGVVSSDQCALEIAQSFLNAPDQQPDQSCIASIADPTFVESDEAIALTFDPFEAEVVGGSLTGVAPSGWGQVIPGTFARQRNGLDQVALVFQAFGPGLLRESEFVDLFAEQLGAETDFELSNYDDSNNRKWTLTETETAGQPLVIATTQDDTALYAVILLSDPNSHAQYLSELLPRVLDEVALAP